MHFSKFLPVFLCCVAAATAQSFKVSPAAYTTKEAPSGTTLIFGDRNNVRGSLQQIHDDLGTKPLILTELAFRNNGARTCVADTLNLTLRLSNTPIDAASVTNTYKSNHVGRCTISLDTHLGEPTP